MSKCSRCLPGKVEVVVLVGGQELCHYCRQPLSEEAARTFEEGLAESRERWRDIGGVPQNDRVERDNEHGYLPPECRSRDTRHDPRLSDREVEKQYIERIDELRKEGVVRRGGMRHLASIPAEDYFGRMKATGDKHYWDDKENLKKHKDYLLGDI